MTMDADDDLLDSAHRHVQKPLAHGASFFHRSLTGLTSNSSDFEDRVVWGLATKDERIEHLRKFMSAGGRSDFTWRMMVAQVIMSGPFEWTLGFMVLAQLVIAAAETDHNAMSRKLPTWVYSLQVAFVTVYVLELTLRIYVWRWQFFLNNGNRFDLTVVALDLGAIIAETMFGDDIPTVAILRCVRMLKLVRTARVLKQFRELYVIAYSLAGVLKSIFWESVVLFVVLTIASIVAVELIHPINVELADDGTYDDCDRCPRAFESVMQSNLTFFQVMVAGDSWGLVIIPIIERRPETAVYFVFLTLLVVLGLMNLILSAIVDKASQVRHIVEATSLLEKRAVINESKVKLVSVCEELDVDKNGSFTMQELKRAIETPIFQEALQVMDLGPDDLETIFGMMDTDASGSISYAELADSLQRIKAQDDHMLLILIQRTLKDCYKKLSRQLEIQATVNEELAAQKVYLHHLGQLVEEEAETLEQVVESSVKTRLFRRDLHHSEEEQADTAKQKRSALEHSKSTPAFPTIGKGSRRESSRNRKLRSPRLGLLDLGTEEAETADGIATRAATSCAIEKLPCNGEKPGETAPSGNGVDIRTLDLLGISSGTRQVISL